MSVITTSPKSYDICEMCSDAEEILQRKINENGEFLIEYIPFYDFRGYEWYCANFPEKVEISGAEIDEIRANNPGDDECADEHEEDYEQEIDDKLLALAYGKAEERLRNFAHLLAAPFADFLREYEGDDLCEENVVEIFSEWRDAEKEGQ